MSQESDGRAIIARLLELELLAKDDPRVLSSFAYLDCASQLQLIFPQLRDLTGIFEEARAILGRIFLALGRQPVLSALSLRDYQSDSFGPYLGVSGDHSAGDAICVAATQSPKAIALGADSPLTIGLAHDAERLGSVGELPVGPEEYIDIRLNCIGRALTSTNVGSRVNTRFYGQIADVWVNESSGTSALRIAQNSIIKRLAPFRDPPDGFPRNATVYVQFNGVTPASRISILNSLREGLAAGRLGHPTLHELVLVARPKERKDAYDTVVAALECASKAGILVVAVEGIVRQAAHRSVSLPGLLNFFNIKECQTLLARAQKLGVGLRPLGVVDTVSVARQVWAALASARQMGLELGKYGLFPLTFEEAQHVISQVQTWFASWTAAPAFYVDQPMVTGTRIYGPNEVVEAIGVWLEMVAKCGTTVVLIDTVDKARGRRLLKTGGNDRKGVLSIDDVKTIDQMARRLRIKALWAGGITIGQAYLLGKLGVFGLYVTTAVSAPSPVSQLNARDPALAFERKPTFPGVRQVKLLVEAGFLCHKIGEGTRDLEKCIESLLNEATEVHAEEEAIQSMCVELWRRLRSDGCLSGG